MVERREECLRSKAKRCTSERSSYVTKWGIDSLSEERTQSFVSTERQEPILRMQAKQMTLCLLKITEYLPPPGKTVCKPSLTWPWILRYFCWSVKKQKIQIFFLLRMYLPTSVWIIIYWSLWFMKRLVQTKCSIIESLWLVFLSWIKMLCYVWQEK